MLFVIMVCIALFITMTVYYAKSDRPVKNAFIGMGSGLVCLGAAKLLLPLLGMAIKLNFLNVFLSVILGPPGVVAAIIMNNMFG